MYSWSPQCTHDHPPVYWISPGVLHRHYAGWFILWLLQFPCKVKSKSSQQTFQKQIKSWLFLYIYNSYQTSCFDQAWEFCGPELLCGNIAVIHYGITPSLNCRYSPVVLPEIQYSEIGGESVSKVGQNFPHGLTKMFKHSERLMVFLYLFQPSF